MNVFGCQQKAGLSAGCCHESNNVGMRQSPVKIEDKEHNVVQHSFTTLIYTM